MSDDKFPGLDAIRARAARPASEKKRPGRPRKVYTAEEFAKLPPSARYRLERRRTSPQLSPEAKDLIIATRQGKLTPSVCDLVGTIMRRTGSPVRHVAGALGIHPTTVDDWIARGGDPRLKDTVYALFAETVARAKSEEHESLYERIKAGGKGWAAAAWMAERRLPQELGPATKRIEHSGTGVGGAIRITGSVSLPEEIPDGHPSLDVSRNSAAKLNGHANGSSYVNGAAPAILAEGVSLPPEDDPD